MDGSLTPGIFSSQSLQQVGETESKVIKEKVLKTLELCQFLVKHVHQQVGGLMTVLIKTWEVTGRCGFSPD